ncbi:related to major facilitator (MFS1) transporter [Rhynchosporium graminicola]|uniref:Related to major facilitator (MFS1) transporter n=1 Tax=Rhynchosporium graminicola TaxID=2792576 RepID=A0A1E1LHT6_9HELO|nr:related to major facilitator (MFS1) transporter [Rhynchosporium commune]
MLEKGNTQQDGDRPLPITTPSMAHINHPNLQNFINEAIVATNPAIRHLASQSSLESQPSGRRSRGSRGDSEARSAISKGIRRLSTNFEEQRHPGRSDLGFASTTKPYEPEKETSRMKTIPEWKGHRVNTSSGLGNEAFGRDDTALIPEVPPSRQSYKSLVVRGDGEEPKTDEGDAVEAATLTGEKDDETKYPGPLGLFILITGIALSVFLISLDRTIITTAIPYISDEFRSYADVGWYGSAYLLTASAFQPLYGRIFGLFNMKWAYLSSLSIFELGSLICAVAPNSVALIVGRAIQGLGSAGILTGSFVVVSHAVPLEKRPLLTAVVGLMFGVGATAGPLLGGVFTDLVTWRWCFYVNLPVGSITFISMVFFFHPPNKHAFMGKSIWYRALELDLTGNAILLGAAVMLFLALQYTEERVPWSDVRVIGLLTGSGCTFITFAVWQWWKADGALMPPRILKQRTVAASCAAAFFIYSAILIHTFYLPMWFQAIKNYSAIRSGVNMIPYVLANAIFSVLAGIFVSKNGYFTVPAIVGMVIGTVGAGFLSTISHRTSSSMWMGYEILASAGIGMAIQQGFTAVQIVLPLEEVAIGTAAVVAFQSLGGAIFVSVGNTILQNTLSSAHIPGVDIQAVIDAGAKNFRSVVPPEHLPQLLEVYNDALRKVFTAAIPLAGLAVVACCFLEWRNVKDQSKKDLESLAKARGEREEIEKAIMEMHRYKNSVGDDTRGYSSGE